MVAEMLENDMLDAEAGGLKCNDQGNSSLLSVGRGEQEQNHRTEEMWLWDPHLLKKVNSYNVKSYNGKPYLGNRCGGVSEIENRVKVGGGVVQLMGN